MLQEITEYPQRSSKLITRVQCSIKMQILIIFEFYYKSNIYVSEMRWFRGHAEAPRLLSLSPLQADEDLDGASYHFHAASHNQYRGKNREKVPIQLYQC